MKLNTLLGLPLVVALGLSLAACDNNTPQAPAANAPAPAADAAADAEKAAAEQKAAEEAAAAEKAAADAKAAEEAAAAKAAEEAAAAAKAAEEAAAAAKAAEEAAAAEKAAAEAKAAEEAAAAAAKAEEEKKAAEAAAAAATATTEAPAATTEAPAATTEAPAGAAMEAPAMEAPAMEAAATGVLPAEGLKPDTRIAAKADTSTFPYLGVWVPDAAACATVDQVDPTGLVVVTSISVRQGSEITIVNATPMTDGKATLTAGDKTIELSMPAPDQLQVGTGSPLVRCAAQ